MAKRRVKKEFQPRSGEYGIVEIIGGPYKGLKGELDNDVSPSKGYVIIWEINQCAEIKYSDMKWAPETLRELAPETLREFIGVVK